MKKTAILLMALLLLSMDAGKKPITLFLAGDSTMAFKPRTEHPERGWGMMLDKYLDPAVTIDNRARNGRSSKSFLSEGLWEGLLQDLKKGDYVVIQFGHNDSSPEKGPDRYSTPEEYRANLLKMIRETRAAKAKPILCTSVVRRRFDEDGNFFDTHGPYPDVVRELAVTEKVPLVDMQKSSEALIRKQGPEDSKKTFLHIQAGAYEILPEGLTDDTHFSARGAELMAGLFAEGLKNQRTGLKKYLKKD
jgi:DNA sulfur modification protein DndE